MKLTLTKEHKVLLVLLVMGILYMAVTNPDGVVVMADGKISGPQNNLREMIQGDSFWLHQCAEVKKAILAPGIAQLLSESISEVEKVRREIRRQERAVKREYKSGEEIVVDEVAYKLRSAADELENEMMIKSLREHDAERRIELHEIKYKINKITNCQ